MFDSFNVWLSVLAISLVCAFLWFLRPRRFPWHFRARVTYVCDGDSIWVRTWYGQRLKLRLLGIDAPETKQPSGKSSRDCLNWLIGGRSVEVVAVNRDVYSRLVCAISYKGQDICLRMIEEGMAWPYFQYMRQLTPQQRHVYREAYELAKREQRGLWRGKNPEMPWEWRRRHRTLWEQLIWWIKRLFGLW